MVGVATAEWPEVAPSMVLPIKEALVPEAVEMLGNASWLALTEEQVDQLVEAAPCPESARLRGYLVRGVAHGGVATYTIVRQDPAADWLIVSHATYDRESMLFVWGLRRVLPLPVVVMLSTAPKHVLPTAELGGDWIFRGGRLNRMRRPTCAAAAAAAPVRCEGGRDSF